MQYFKGGMTLNDLVDTIYYVVLKDTCPYNVLGKMNFYGRIENQTASNIYFSLMEEENNSLVIIPHDWIKFMTPIKVNKSKE